MILVLGTFFLAIPWKWENAQAASILHDVGDVDFFVSDDGRITELIWNGVVQTAESVVTGLDYIGLVIDHDDYDHFNAGNPPDDGDGMFLTDFMEDTFTGSDFDNVVVPIHFEENTPLRQESMTRYNHTSYDIWDLNFPYSEIDDLDVEQTVWSLANEDWAVIQWDVINTKTTPLIDLYVGFYMAVSSLAGNDNRGLGGDSNDESNGWINNMDCNDGIWFQDAGSMTTMALAPALTSVSLDQCYVTSNDAYMGPLAIDDELLYTASNAPNQLEPAGGDEDKYVLLGWNVGDIPSGFKVSLPLIIAFNNSVAGVQNDILDARDFYFLESLPIMVTEFQDEPTAPNPQRIEVYNDMGSAIDLVANSFGFSTPTHAQLLGTWNPTTVPAYSHSVFEVNPATPLNTEGDIIRLVMGALIVEEVRYGQYGVAPDPVLGQSSARIWDSPSITYGNDWTMTLPTNPPPFDNAPTWGIMNYVPPVIDNPGLVLNEVAFDPSITCAEGYIEFMYIFDIGSIDFSLSNHYVVVDEIHPVTSGSVDPVNRYHYIMESGYPAQFDLDYAGDNVYLFNSTGSLFDMTGWDSLHSPGSMGRIPEGEGTYGAYDDNTATGAGWAFLPRVTYIDSYISIEDDQTGGADPDSDASYNLTVRNYQASPDDITLSYSSQIGWPVSFYYDAISWVPINDGDSGNAALNGDSLPDFTIGALSTMTITVNVSVPQSTLLTSENENSTVWAESFNERLSCPPGIDAATLFTQVYPYLQILKDANPSTFWLNGAGSPDVTDVDLTIRGAGTPQIVYKPQDVVFIIDRSNSMGNEAPFSDPTGVVLQAVKNYIDDMGPNDRAATVAFGVDYEYYFIEQANYPNSCWRYEMFPLYRFCGVWGSWLVDDMGTDDAGFPRAHNPLHLLNMDLPSKAVMKNAVDTLDDFWPAGSTNIELAIQTAHTELIPGYSPMTTWIDDESVMGIPYERMHPPDLPGNSDGSQFGDPTHVWAEILLTDGIPYHGQSYPEDNDELQAAIDNNIKIYTIGLLGPICNIASPYYDPAQCTASEAYLQHIASFTGGQYYYADDASDLIGIYDTISKEIKTIAASPPQTPAVTMVTDVLPDYMELVPGSITVDTGGFMTSGCMPPGSVCSISWDVNEDISIGEEHWMNYQIKANVPSPPNWNITKKPEANTTYTNWRGVEVTAEIPDVFVTVLSPQLLPPYVTDIMVVGNELNITWNLSPSLTVNAYDIYGGPTQTSIDFTTVIASTPNETAPASRMWAQFPFDFTGDPEYYFVVRARNNAGGPEWSPTSNTAGYYTVDFDSGTNTFSLPLEPFPFSTMYLEYYLADIPNANSISYLDGNDDWQTITPPTMPPFTQAFVGTGYVLETSDVTSHIFTGQPSAMISYTDTFAWDFQAGALVSAVASANDVTLTWPSLGGGVEYYVYRSTMRDGFFPGSPGMYTILNGGSPVPGTTYIDIGAASAPSDYHYMIVPYNTGTTELGSSTYSVGVLKFTYNGNEMIGLPLKPQWGYESADWYVDMIPNCLGMIYLEGGVWKAHFKEFPAGVYDTILELGRGYELSVHTQSFYIYVGW
jgi:hypothetical protein